MDRTAETIAREAWASRRRYSPIYGLVADVHFDSISPEEQAIEIQVAKDLLQRGVVTGTGL